MPRDYYDVLGVSPTAPGLDGDLKRAHHLLQRFYHPDVYEGTDKDKMLSKGKNFVAG